MNNPPNATQRNEPYAEHAHNYRTVNLSGNVQAILGNVYSGNSFFSQDRIFDRQNLAMKALYFEGMRSRKQQIDKRAGCPEHINWVWRTSFPAWLEAGGSFYWITGRPGSGKSTLMKHIAESRQTISHLQFSGDKWTTLHFFFDFRAGKGIASSPEGMLRSLLHQIVKNCPDLAQRIDHATFNDAPGDHSLQICMDNVCDAIIQCPTRVCAFIDGLDEYDGAELLAMIQSLEDRTGIKLCLASRPYDIFQRNLSEFPNLAVQDYNDESIRMYAEFRWQSKQLGFLANLPLSLSDKVRQKARGVFLWARLVFDELFQEFLNGKDADYLEALLEQMPREVEEMYQRILNQLPYPMQSEAAILLYLIMASSNGYADVRKLYAALASFRVRHGLRNKIMPIDQSTDNNRDFLLFSVNSSILKTALNMDVFTIPVSEHISLIYKAQSSQLSATSIQ